jgi:uncharacterized protein
MADRVFYLTRRDLIRASSSVALALALEKKASASSDRARALEHGNPLAEFDYGSVRLQPGPHQAQLEQTHAILMGLNEDSLLRPFRYFADLPAPGFELGGWYSSNDRDPGHSFGQWISALSRYYAITGDAKTREKLFLLLDGYAQTVEPSGKFFYKAYPKVGITSEASYTYGMLVGGLADAHEFAHYPAALSILSRVTDAALPHIPDRVLDNPTVTDWGFMMPHNLFIAWQRGARDDHLQLAQHYIHHEFFDALARGEDVLGDRHAYSHLDALNSAVMAYLVLGDIKYLKAAVNGFAFVERQSFVTGGWGPNEKFLPQSEFNSTSPDGGERTHYAKVNSLADDILHGRDEFETGCGSYAHLKLTRYLLRITKDPHYGDSMERVIYNAALGMLPLNKLGKAFYQSNYHRYARKAYFDGYGNAMQDAWPCCSGTLTQLAADYGLNSYFRNDSGVYVNLYIPSRLSWLQDSTQLSLTQEGHYPLSDRVSVAIGASSPTLFTLRFRIPAWTHGPVLRVNGESVTPAARPGSFAEIRRRWRDGDKVELTFPRQLELVAADTQHPDLVALCCGPLVLFAIGDDLPKLNRQTLLSAKQTAEASGQWRSGDVKFLPWWIIKEETYTTYHDVS